MVTGKLASLIAMYHETPWMILPSYLDARKETLRSFLNNPAQVMDVELHEDCAPKVEYNGRTAVLHIEGEMLPKCDGWATFFGYQSTAKVHELFLELANDRSIEGIVLYFDCPGGVAIGGDELAQDIWNCEKPVVAFTDGYMTSLAYLWASACDRIYATPTAQVGSIGVILSLYKIKQEGLTVYNIKAGEKKDYGSPYTELTAEEIEYFQQKVNYSYDKFVSQVSEFRAWDKEEIIATQAQYGSAGAIPHFVDEIITKKDFITQNF